MKVAGIIAEYNPFHEGHKYQLQLAKKDFDAVIVIMSGHFVQRGEVAVFDKWERANAAIRSGADLVLELPVVFSLNTAERFAYGAVSVLNSINIVDSLIFGSESGDIDNLFNAAQMLEDEPPQVTERIKAYLNEGFGYPSAREKAFTGFISPELLSKPNNLLGIEYLRQLIRLKSDIIPITHKRIGADYHDINIDTKFPSATAIREQILKGYSYDEFKNAVIHRTERLETAILYNIRKNKQKAFLNISDVSEGLENRITSKSYDAKSLFELESMVSGKRYTRSKIRRILLSSLLGLDKNLSKTAPPYIRILGMSKTGFSLVKETEKNSNIDIITKTALYKKENKMFEKDILATDIYDLTADTPYGGGSDYKKSPIIGG